MEWGGTQAAGIRECKKLCGKAGVINRWSFAAALAVSVFSGKSCWVCLQSRSLEPQLLPLHEGYWYPLLLVLVPCCLYTPLLCQPLGWVKLKQNLCAVP